MLGLGLGATSMVFSLVNSVLLKPLPYAQPERLVSIREVIPKIAHLYPTLPVNARHFVEWRQSCPSLESMSVFQPGTLNLTGAGEPERLDAAIVSANLFRVLGDRPAQGRDFRDEEEQAGKDTVAILTDGLWRRRFHADPSLLGRTISLNGRVRTVVGILAPDFRFPTRNAFATGQAAAPHAEVFVPKVFSSDELRQLLGTHNYAVIARLRPGASREQAVAQLEAVQARMEAMAGEKIHLRAVAYSAARDRGRQLPARSARAHGRRCGAAADCLRQPGQPSSGPQRAPQPASSRCARRWAPRAVHWSATDWPSRCCWPLAEDCSRRPSPSSESGC